MNPVHFSSAREDWGTPREFASKYVNEYGLELDVCASPENAVCPCYFTKDQDAFKQKWDQNFWMNPPYSYAENACKNPCSKKRCAERGFHRSEYHPGTGDWVRLASNASSRHGVVGVCLLPARTDTNWFHSEVLPIIRGDRLGQVSFIKGRLKFEGAKDSAPFPSMVVVFK